MRGAADVARATLPAPQAAMLAHVVLRERIGWRLLAAVQRSTFTRDPLLDLLGLMRLGLVEVHVSIPKTYVTPTPIGAAHIVGLLAPRRRALRFLQ